MKPYIASAKATVVPLLHGSGTRLKCVESMALKTQIISTDLGAEGIEHEGSIITADDPYKFKSEILEVLQGNRISQKKLLIFFYFLLLGPFPSFQGNQ